MAEVPPPTCLPWFANINRYWDARRARFVAKILPGEYYVTTQGEMIGTVLGSCVSACVRDPSSGIGGMNHFMLPARAGGKVELLSDAFRYGNFAMEHLINDVMKLSGTRSNLEFKLFGGGNVVKGMSSVGARNVEFVRKYLEMESFRITSEDLGGNYPRKILYDPKSGKVMMRKIQTLHNDTLVQREESYRDQISNAPVSGEVDLF
ncbi:MAG: chemoreceptor glutamine deamidase CheD [Hahellaceae bacterium]|nr:chemoreceptor glutamine deamidase CheD [Hahellaceae bacterium]